MNFPATEPPPRLPGFVWVYILEHADHSYYIGQSWDVAERLLHHRNGDGGKHPADHREPRLVYREGPFPLATGIARERQLKRWSRAKKEALIRGDLVTLRALSQSREAGLPAARRFLPYDLVGATGLPCPAPSFPPALPPRRSPPR